MARSLPKSTAPPSDHDSAVAPADSSVTDLHTRGEKMDFKVSYSTATTEQTGGLGRLKIQYVF